MFCMVGAVASVCLGPAPLLQPLPPLGPAADAQVPAARRLRAVEVEVGDGSGAAVAQHALRVHAGGRDSLQAVEPGGAGLDRGEERKVSVAQTGGRAAVKWKCHPNGTQEGFGGTQEPTGQRCKGIQTSLGGQPARQHCKGPHLLVLQPEPLGQGCGDVAECKASELVARHLLVLGPLRVGLLKMAINLFGGRGG